MSATEIITPPNLVMLCPECRQNHQTAKATEQCVIAAMNRWLISDPIGENHARAHLRYFNTVVYYRTKLIGPLPEPVPPAYETQQIPVTRASTTSLRIITPT